MANKLKHFRVTSGMTQAKVAKAIGVTQPTYQRWEAGTSEIPEEKVDQLSNVFGTSTEALLGRHAPIEAACYDDSAPEDLQIYGDVAIHFAGLGKSLLLKISEQIRSSIFRAIQTEQNFIVMRDLGNRTVIVRRAAISDLYLSSEAYDDYGPEHNEPGYEHGTPYAVPDGRDWEIIERLTAEIGTSDFAEEDVDRVVKAINKNENLTDQIFKLATHAIYQLSSGLQRIFDVTDCELYDPLSSLIEYGFDDENSIVLQPEGYHRAIYINLESIDYISIPSHLYDKDCLDLSAELLDSLPDDDIVAPLRGHKSKSRPTNDI